MHKIVIDTNVYISGIFWKGKPRKLLHLAKEGKLRVCVSRSILDELKDVTTRPDKNFKLSLIDVEKIIKDILSYTILVVPTQTLDRIKVDPQDNRILECALEAKANFIISGDPHLKKIGQFKNIRIVTPAEFLEILGEE